MFSLATMGLAQGPNETMLIVQGQNVTMELKRKQQQTTIETTTEQQQPTFFDCYYHSQYNNLNPVVCCCVCGCCYIFPLALHLCLFIIICIFQTKQTNKQNTNQAAKQTNKQ